MLDTAISVATPEGIEFDLVPSGPLARILAYAIDFLIRAVVLLVLAFVLQGLGAFGSGIILICFFLLEWLYPVVFEASKGSTPGKYWMHLKVVLDDGTPITLSSSMLRNLLRTADFLPLFYLTGLCLMATNNRHKRLGDLAAAAMVVQVPSASVRPIPAMVKPVPAGFAMTADERQAIIQFSLRIPVLSAARQTEIAMHLVPLVGGPKEEASLRLQQIASDLLGQAVTVKSTAIKSSEIANNNDAMSKKAVSTPKDRD